MPPIQNPFFVGKPVPSDHFIGRKAAVNTAFDQILQKNHLALYGSPGRGKTSLLKFLAEDKTWQNRGLDRSNAVIAYINCADILPFTSASFWRETISVITDKAADDAALKAELDKLAAKDVFEKSDLKTALRKIGDRKKFLVMLIDDYDAALRANDKFTETDMLVFLSEFRSLAVHSDESKYLSTIVTSFRKLTELGPKQTPSGSPWYNHYLFHPLKPFNDNEVKELFNRMPTQWPLNELQKGAIREIAHAHPALLQNACNILCGKLINDEDVKDAVKYAREFASATEHFFRDIWDFSADSEKMCMTLLALSRLDGRLNKKRQYKVGEFDIILSQLDRELRDLEDRGVVSFSKEGGIETYSFASSIMEWWIVKEIENSKDDSELQKWEKTFLNLSRQQVDNIKAILRDVWKNKDAIQEIVGWIGGVAGAFKKGLLAN